MIIEKSNDNIFSAYTPNTKSTVLNGQGKTVKEAIDNMKIALSEVIESYSQSGEAIPIELKEIVFEYHYDIPSLFHCFSMINLSGFALMYRFDESLLNQYKNGITIASEKQAKKNEKALNELGKSFLDVRIV